MRACLARTIAGEDAPPGLVRLVVGTSTALATVALIGFFDYRTGPDYILAIFYRVPILLATLYFNRVAGLVVAAASTGVWMCSDVLLAADRVVHFPRRIFSFRSFQARSIAPHQTWLPWCKLPRWYSGSREA